MKKLFFGIIISLFIFSAVYAQDFTTTYSLETPSTGTRNWTSVFSADMISIDRVLTIISTDVNSTTDDAITTVGSAVGRFKLVSSDGTSCYILVYSDS